MNYYSTYSIADAFRAAIAKGAFVILTEEFIMLKQKNTYTVFAGLVLDHETDRKIGARFMTYESRDGGKQRPQQGYIIPTDMIRELLLASNSGHAAILKRLGLPHIEPTVIGKAAAALGFGVMTEGLIRVANGESDAFSDLKFQFGEAVITDRLKSGGIELTVCIHETNPGWRRCLETIFNRLTPNPLLPVMPTRLRPVTVYGRASERDDQVACRLARKLLKQSKGRPVIAVDVNGHAYARKHAASSQPL